MEYLVITYTDLDSLSSKLDIEYQRLYKQMTDANATGGNLVYFKRYTTWHWIVIDEKIPVDWMMELILR